MRAGMPRRNHGAQHGRKRDRSRTDRPLYRLRALRRRVSHRFGDPQRLPAAARTHRRYQPSTRTGAGFGADPLAALEPRADAAPHTRRSPATDRRSGTLRPHGLELPQVSFTLVTEPEQLRRIADFTVGVFASTARKLLHPVVRTLLKPLRPDLYRYAARFAEIEREHKAGNDPDLTQGDCPAHHPYARFQPIRMRGCESGLPERIADGRVAGRESDLHGIRPHGRPHGQEKCVRTDCRHNGPPQAIMALGIPAFRYSKYTER